MEQQNQQSLEMPFIPFENIQLICEYVWLDQTENRTYYISILFCYWVSDIRLSEEHVKFTTHHSKSPPLDTASCLSCPPLVYPTTTSVEGYHNNMWQGKWTFNWGWAYYINCLRAKCLDKFNYIVENCLYQSFVIRTHSERVYGVPYITIHDIN